MVLGFFVALGGLWWFLVVLCCSCGFLVVLDGSWWLLVVLGGSWWFFAVIGCSLQFLVVLGGSRWTKSKYREDKGTPFPNLGANILLEAPTLCANNIFLI